MGRSGDRTIDVAGVLQEVPVTLTQNGDVGIKGDVRKALGDE